MKKINIQFPYSEMIKRETRWKKAWNFEQPDRIPVLHYIGSRYWLPLIGYGNRFRDYLNDPGIMLEAQLLGAKWILENIKSDYHQIVFYPDFMWVEDVEPFGAEIVYPEDDSPWVARPHFLQKNDNLDQLRSVDYTHNGLHGKMISFYHEMKKQAQDYEIHFSDGKIIPAIDCVMMGGGGIIGPTVIAGDLRSADNFAMDLYDRPDWAKDLLSIISEKAIDWLNTARKIGGGKVAFCSSYLEGATFIGDDGTAQLSPKQFREFAFPALKKLAEDIRNQGLKVIAHNCGQADHLLDLWTNEVGIDIYYGFSYLTNKNLLKEIMGGKVLLIGGIDTVKLHGGKPEDVREDVRKTLEVFKNCPGYIIMDGHNVAPGTPVENLNAITDAAEEFGRF